MTVMLLWIILVLCGTVGLALVATLTISAAHAARSKPNVTKSDESEK